MTKLKLFSALTIILLVQNLGFSQKEYASLSEELIDAVRFDKPHADLLKKLADVPQNTLAKELDTDDAKKAFWINIYNAHIQIFLKENPDLYKDRNKFFKEDRVVVAGKKLSFDKIEHGIIRRSKNKYSLGFFGKICVDRYEKKFRVKKVDARIHLALNCGALSCPAVAKYNYKMIEKQLEQSSKIHLKNTSVYDKENNEVLISRLFSWFRADFGDKDEVRAMLKKHDIIPKDATPSIKYDEYDWTMKLDNFIDL